MIGGRSGWIAWPAGVMCAGVVAGLVWLAAPGVPAAVDFVATTIENAPPFLEQTSTAPEAAPLTEDCRSLYPGVLWLALGWSPDVFLTQSTDPPQTSVKGLAEGLRPTVLMTCSWRKGAAGSISTTLSSVDPAGIAAAQSSLVAAGFTCDPSGDGVRCIKVDGIVREDETLRGGMWLATTESSWHFAAYTDQLIGRLWP